MTDDQNYTTQQERQRSGKKRFPCAIVLWWEGGTKLEYSMLGEVQFSKPGVSLFLVF